MRLIDADRLLQHTKFYNLKNGNRAIDEIDILHAPTVEVIPLDKVKQAREKIEKLRDEEIITDQCSEAPMEQYITEVGEGLELALDVLDELIESEEE